MGPGGALAGSPSPPSCSVQADLGANLKACSCFPFLPSHGHGTLYAYRPFASWMTGGFSTSKVFLVVRQVNVTTPMLRLGSCPSTPVSEKQEDDPLYEIEGRGRRSASRRRAETSSNTEA